MIFLFFLLKAGGKPSTWFPPGGTRRAGWLTFFIDHTHSQPNSSNQFFRPERANFVTIFGSVKTYKPKNPSGWHYLLEKSSPKMDSHPNSNG